MIGKKTEMTIRIVLDLVILASVFFGPFWFSATLAILGLVYFKNFYEIIMVGIFIDLLYGVPLVRFYNFTFVATLLAVILFIIKTIIRRKLFLTR